MYLRQDTNGIISTTSFKFMMATFCHWYDTVIHIIGILPEKIEKEMHSKCTIVIQVVSTVLAWVLPN